MRWQKETRAATRQFIEGMSTRRLWEAIKTIKAEIHKRGKKIKPIETDVLLSRQPRWVPVGGGE